MITMNVVCKPVFIFDNGRVEGHIEIDPDAILDAIFSNVTMSYSGKCRMSTRKLIAGANSANLNSNCNPVIVLEDGVVKNNFLQLDMSTGAHLLSKYLNDYIYLVPKSKYIKEHIENFNHLVKYVDDCRDCDTPSDTANVPGVDY